MNLTPKQPTVDEEGPSINPMELVHFVWAAARRNFYTCLTVGFLTLSLGLAIVSALPRTYESTSKVYVTTSTTSITSQLTSGRRTFGDEGVLRDVYESVFNHANLLNLAREAKLVENWPKTRNWAQRLYDEARLRLRGPTSREDTEAFLIDLLENSIAVANEDSASIRFRAQWRDPGTAQKLTLLVQRNYIASKEVEELSAITRATTVLEEERKRADDAFEPAVNDLKEQIAKLREQAKSKLTPAPRVAAPAAPAEPVSARPLASQLELTAKLNDLRAEERAVLEPWQRRTAEIKFQLADLRAVYGPAHPTVLQLEAKLKAASAEPLELLDIRQREADLKATIASWVSGGSARSLAAGGGSRAAGVTTAVEQDAVRNLIGNAADDPSLAPARLQLETALRKSAEMQARLDMARMELAIAQVGFKYRYRQVEPARFWAKPIKPKIPVLRAAAVAAALVLGFLAGAGRELLNGKIMETWQVKQVGVEVIATVDVRSWQLHEPPSRRLPPSSTSAGS